MKIINQFKIVLYPLIEIVVNPFDEKEEQNL